MARERVATREVLPQSLRAFYIQARQNTFAAGLTPVDDPLIHGSKELRFDNGIYYYYDRYFDNPQRRGNFLGIETVTLGEHGGEMQAAYSYGGGLLGKGLSLGESTVYGRLKTFLMNNAQIARFGSSVRELMTDEVGVWIYESRGLVRDWGWADVEYLNLDGDLVYEFQGQGICQIPVSSLRL